MQYRGPTRGVRIAGFKPCRRGCYVTLADTGKSLFIPDDLIVEACFKTLFVPEWFYRKEISPLAAVPGKDHTPVRTPERNP